MILFSAHDQMRTFAFRIFFGLSLTGSYTRETRANSVLSNRLFSWNWCMLGVRFAKINYIVEANEKSNTKYVFWYSLCGVSVCVYVRVYFSLSPYHCRTSGLFCIDNWKQMIVRCVYCCQYIQHTCIMLNIPTTTILCSATSLNIQSCTLFISIYSIVYGIL